MWQSSTVSGEEQIGLIIGVVIVGVFLIAVVVLLLVFVMLKRRGDKNSQGNSFSCNEFSDYVLLTYFQQRDTASDVW
jgi:heme/copper-type cytochrome/quinol oxidase subunit 2